MKTKRLEYIDIIRSIAIIMMLEGHFMTHSLQTVFRDDENPIYAVWKFTRGLTAPLFLSISGLIFSYLLLKNKTQGWHNPRVQKGFKRTGVLILLGYLLQFNLYTHFFSHRPLFTSLTQIFHVLQCIGASLFLLIGVYLLKTYVLKIPLGLILTTMGVLVVAISPTMYNLDYTNVPRFLENILVVSKNTDLKVSVFPLFPWCGYVFFGGALGCLIVKLGEKAHHILFPVGLIASGILMNLITYSFFGVLQLLPFFDKLQPFQYAYEPVRFCQVLIFIGFVIVVRNLLGISFLISCYLFTIPLQTVGQNITAYAFFFIPVISTLWKLTGWDYTTFLKIGQNTLSVYVVHVVLLYQGFFGFRIDRLVKDNLNPFFAISGAIIFVFLFLAYTQYEPILINKINRLKIRYKIVKRKIQYRTSTI